MGVTELTIPKNILIFKLKEDARAKGEDVTELANTFLEELISDVDDEKGVGIKRYYHLALMFEASKPLLFQISSFAKPKLKINRCRIQIGELTHFTDRNAIHSNISRWVPLLTQGLFFITRPYEMKLGGITLWILMSGKMMEFLIQNAGEYLRTTVSY